MITEKKIPILLIGAGHSHMQLLFHARHDRKFLDSVTLISDQQLSFYSGMMASWLESIYKKEDVSVDISALSKSYQIPFILGEVVKFSPSESIVTLSDGQTLRYEQVSFDIGSISAIDLSMDLACKAYTLKPFEQITALQKVVTSNPKGSYSVIGSGVASIEIAGAMAALTSHSDAKIDIVTKSEGLLPKGSKNLRRHVIKMLSSYRHLGIKKSAQTTCNAVVWAIGPKAPELFRSSNILTNEKGYLNVEPTLQSSEYKNVWGAGDCINMKTQNLAKTGVNAVREALILYHNLKHTQSTNPTPLKQYKPRKNYLAIYSTGNKSAILHYGAFVWSGKLPWIIKDKIDRKYIKKHQNRYLNNK